MASLLAESFCKVWACKRQAVCTVKPKGVKTAGVKCCYRCAQAHYGKSHLYEIIHHPVS